jgi:hypothetical protein
VVADGPQLVLLHGFQVLVVVVERAKSHRLRLVDAGIPAVSATAPAYPAN